jgi:hypothetical protein
MDVQTTHRQQAADDAQPERTSIHMTAGGAPQQPQVQAHERYQQRDQDRVTDQKAQAGRRQRAKQQRETQAARGREQRTEQATLLLEKIFHALVSLNLHSRTVA